MESFWLWLWWWVFDPTRFIIGFIWIGLIVGILAVERRRRKLNLPPPTADPTCPKCGYLVIGLPGKVCPECGSDLTSVGVIRRDDTRTSPLARVALWTLLLALPGVLVWRNVGPRLPVLRARTVTQTFNGPLSGAYKSVEIRSVGRQWEWRDRTRIGVPYDRLEFRLQPVRGSERTYVVRQPVPTDAQRQAFVDQLFAATSPSDRPKVFDREQLLKWMRSLGINAEDPRVKDEVEVICVKMDERSMGAGVSSGTADPFTSTPLVYTGFYGRPIWMNISCIAVALLIWLAGLIIFARRRTLPYERVALPQEA